MNKFLIALRIFSVSGAALVGFWIPIRLVGFEPTMELEILFDLLISVVSVVNIYLFFIDEEVNPREWRNWFSLSVLLDILCAMPFALIAFFVFDGAAHWMLIINLLAARHIAHIKFLLDSFDNLKPMTYRLLPILIGLPILIHVIACGWIVMGSGNALAEGDSELTIYIKAVYWAMTTLTTVGYGDITPKTPWQMVYAALTQILGVGFFGYVLSNVASLIARSDAAREHHMDNLDRIETFMKTHKIPDHLRAKTRSYFHYLWNHKKGYRDNALLKGLPDKIQSDLYFFINRSIIEKVPFLRLASPELIEDLMNHLEPRIVVPGERIFKVGDPGDSLYFIQSGAVRILTKEGSVVAELSDGSFFGEMALLSDRRRSATAVASQYCDLYSLSKGSFERVIHSYPEFHEHVQKVMKERQNA